MVIVDFLKDNIGVISSVSGFVFFAVSKLVSNEKAGGIVSKIQVFFNKAASLCLKAGEGLGYVSKILSDVLKSDGILGKK